VTIFCFVNKDGSVRFEDEKNGCLKYEFSLKTRMMTIEPLEVERSLRQDAIARNHFDNLVGTPEKLMSFAQLGRLSKLELADLLSPEKKQAYLHVCAGVERALTETCTAKGEPCLENGCAVEGEICLNALLESGEIYTVAYVSAWTYLFINPENRVSVWKN